MLKKDLNSRVLPQQTKMDAANREIVDQIRTLMKTLENYNIFFMTKLDKKHLQKKKTQHLLKINAYSDAAQDTLMVVVVVVVGVSACNQIFKGGGLDRISVFRGEGVAGKEGVTSFRWLQFLHKK